MPHQHILAQHGADVMITGNVGRQWQPIHWAATNGHAGTVSTLIQFGADVNCISNNGYTPIYVASENGHIDVVKIY